MESSWVGGPKWRPGLGGEAKGSTNQGRAGNLKAEGGSEQLGGATERGAEVKMGQSN